MTREILFCGKRIDNGKWVEGFYWKDQYDNAYIRTVAEADGCSEIIDYQIDPETSSQFTGFTDSFGLKKFENWIIEDDSGATAPIVFEDGSFYADYEGYEPQYLGEWGNVVGNIFDNPELLEVKE